MSTIIECPNPYCNEGHVYGVEMGDVNLGHGPCETCDGKGYFSVKDARLDMDMTQEDLGKKIGKSARTIQRYESGETPTPILVLNAVKKLFDDKIEAQS